MTPRRPGASPRQDPPRGLWALRSAGLAGIGFVLLMAASVVVQGGRPDTFATDRAIQAFFQPHANQLRGAVAAFLAIPAAALFVWFLGGLAARLRSADGQGGQLSMAVALGGGVFVTLILVARLLDNATAALLAFSHAYRIDPQEARLAAGLAYWVQGAAMAGASVLLVAASMLARRAHLLPRWAALAGCGLAALAPASVALNGAPILLFFGWIVAAGVVLARRADRSADCSADPSQPRREQP